MSKDDSPRVEGPDEIGTIHAETVKMAVDSQQLG